MNPRLLLLIPLLLVLCAPALLSGCTPPPPDPCEKYKELQYRLCDWADKTEQCRVAGMKLMECVEGAPNDH